MADVGGHFVIAGTTRSGKTTWLKRQLRETPAFLVLDVDEHYTDLPYTERVETAVQVRDQLRTRLAGRRQHNRMALVADDPEEHRKAVALLYAFHRHVGDRVEPTALVMDEAKLFKMWGSDQVLPQAYGDVLFSGAKRGLMSAVAALNLQQIPSQVRHLSDRQLLLRLPGPLPPDVRRKFGGRADQVPNLEPLKPGVEPVEGTHYLFHPEGLDPEEVWRSALGLS